MLMDREDKVRSLQSLLDKPTLLAPVFSKCPSVCPLMMATMRREMQKLPSRAIQVIVLSFAKEDQAQDLVDFAQKHQLPDDWQVLRISQGRTELFDQLHYPIMELEDGEYSHQGVIFGLSQNATILGASPSQSFEADDVKTILKVASLESIHPGLGAYVHTLLNPEFWAFVGLLGLILSILVICYVLYRPKKHNSEPAKAQG